MAWTWKGVGVEVFQPGFVLPVLMAKHKPLLQSRMLQGDALLFVTSQSQVQRPVHYVPLVSPNSRLQLFFNNPCLHFIWY